MGKVKIGEGELIEQVLKKPQEREFSALIEKFRQ